MEFLIICLMFFTTFCLGAGCVYCVLVFAKALSLYKQGYGFWQSVSIARDYFQ